MPTIAANGPENPRQLSGLPTSSAVRQNREWKERADRVRSTPESGRSACAATNCAGSRTRGHRLQGESKLALRQCTATAIPAGSVATLTLRQYTR